jgi:Zn-dependent protease
MSWNKENADPEWPVSVKPVDYSRDSFSEYSNPAGPGKDAVDNADPRHYQPPFPGASPSAPISPETFDYTDPRYYQQQFGQVPGPAPEPAAKQAGPFAKVAKFGVASVSALASIAIYSYLFGGTSASWTFAIGLVALLFLHESGHAIVMKLKGMPIGGMVFIPMLGAAVFMSRMPRSAGDEAEVGIAGPVAGCMASAVCLFIALSHPYGSMVWASLAYFGFFMNLFNLIPIVPFDGGRVLAAIDRRIWIIGFLGLVGIQIWQWIMGTNSVWLLLFIAMAAMQLFMRRGNTPEAQEYYAVPLQQRIVLGVAYFGLAAVLVLGMSLAHGLMAYSPIF